MQSTGVENKPVLLGETGLFGIRSTPDSNRSNIGLVVLNAGMVSNVGPFRMSVELAECTANMGLTTLRLDQSGKGESPFRAEISATDSALLDYDEAFANFERLGVVHTILVGSCSGAIDALRIAARRESVKGLVLLDGFVGKTPSWYLHRSAHALRWIVRSGLGGIARRVTSQFTTNDSGSSSLTGDLDWPDSDLRRCYTKVLDRGVNMLSIFSGKFLPYNHLGQLRRFLAVKSNQTNFEEVFFQEADHIYTTNRDRDQLIATISQWIESQFLTSNESQVQSNEKNS